MHLVGLVGYHNPDAHIPQIRPLCTYYIYFACFHNSISLRTARKGITAIVNPICTLRMRVNPPSCGSSWLIFTRFDGDLSMDDKICFIWDAYLSVSVLWRKPRELYDPVAIVSLTYKSVLFLCQVVNLFSVCLIGMPMYVVYAKSQVNTKGNQGIGDNVG